MIFIEGNVPSLKNGKIMGKYHSKSVTKYLRSLGIQNYSASRKEVKGYKDLLKPNKFKKVVKEFKSLIKDKPLPIKVGFYFIRDSKRKFDFNNANQLIADLLVAHGALEDDNMDFFLPFPMELEGKYYHVDKEKSGVYLKIL